MSTTYAHVTSGPRAGESGVVTGQRQDGRFLQVRIAADRDPVWVMASDCSVEELSVEVEPEQPKPEPSVLNERLQGRFRQAAGLRERAA